MPETATPPGQPDTADLDAAVQVPDQDPFAVPDQTEDQVQAIDGTPDEEAPVENLPIPDADLNPHQHG